MSSKIPRGAHLPAETKKPAHRFESNDAATAAAAQRSDGVLRTQKENMQRKNVASKVHKGISTRYGQQAELTEQNKHLTVVNEELQRNLTQAKDRAAELEKENAELQKKLTDCHVLLVAAELDPGRRIREEARHNQEQREEAMSVSEELLNELRTFGENALQQRGRLEEIQSTMAKLSRAREDVTKQREGFSLQAEEMERALEEAESLLL